jgi:hypothetical protein
MSLCLVKHHTMNMYGGVEVQLHALASALDGASRTGHFTSEKRGPGTDWIGGWVGPRVCLDAVEKRKTSYPCRGSNYHSFVDQPWR